MAPTVCVAKAAQQTADAEQRLRELLANDVELDADGGKCILRDGKLGCD